MKLNDILRMNVTPDEEIGILKMIAATDPRPEIVEDIETYISGLKSDLGEDTIRMLNRCKENLTKNILLVREEKRAELNGNS